MRKFLPVLLFAAAAMIPAGAEAQFAVKGGLSFGSATESDYLPDLSSKTGFAGGLSFGLDLGKVVEIRPELLFVQKGGKLSGDDSFTLNEFNIPLLLQIDIPIKGFMPYIVAGPQAEIELKCTAFDTDCVDTSSFRWGAVGGVGIRLGKVFSVEGRYNWTLSEISDDITSKPRTILLLAGIHFGAKQ
jgi:hypothetical protein